MEKKTQPTDRQGLSPHREAEPDDLPMTGEEDPLAEVSDGDFSEVVAEFARSEHARK